MSVSQRRHLASPVTPVTPGRALTCAGSSSDAGERSSTPHGTSWPGGKTTALGQQCVCREARQDAPARHTHRGREQVAQGQCGTISGAGQEAPDSQPSGSPQKPLEVLPSLPLLQGPVPLPCRSGALHLPRLDRGDLPVRTPGPWVRAEGTQECWVLRADPPPFPSGATGPGRDVPPGGQHPPPSLHFR